MFPNRNPRRALALLFAAVAAVTLSLRAPAPALGQHSEQSGMVGAQNEIERRLFPLLACVCGGCPHEPLSTCSCGYADGYRNQIREMIAKGMSEEAIKAEWAKRHGTDALTVPPNVGANQLIYIAPLGAIVAMAGVVIIALRRFRRREEAEEKAAPIAAAAPGDKGDEYDSKLDEELKQLDDE